MFSLESLAHITGILSASIDGVTAWFAQCLEMRICGEGGEFKPLNWPKKTTKRKDEDGNIKRVPKRESWQPLLDWKNFAQRNGIAFPKNAERRFFPNL